MASNTAHRRYELDWLRVFAILIVLVYHSSRFFNLGDWHVKNINTFVWVEIWNVFATCWMMPLFFIISGASLFYAISKSGGWSRFYADKFMRLMIPVLVASVTHSALQIYLERLTHGQLSGSFFSFFPEYFNGVYFGIGMPGNFAFHGMHLWYLLFLFIYSLICYRLFIWLKGSGRKILNRILSWFTIPGSMYVGFSIPLLILKGLVPRAVLEVGSGGWGFLHYIWFLIAGFMIVSSERLQQHILNQRWISFLLGLVLSTALLYQLFSPSRVVFPVLIADWIYALLTFLSAWSWLFAILGFGMKTAHPFFDFFRKRGVMIILQVLYVSLIVFAVAGASRSRSPMPLKYDPGQDILLNSESITDQSSTGVHVVNDEGASIGKAIEFSSGANPQAESEPNVYVEMRFSAPAAQYVVWLRGKTDVNSGYTDSVWAQVDDQIGTRTKSVRLGNWLDVHPVGVYGWASDLDSKRNRIEA